MLTVTGQNEDSSHGLQIGKNQKGDNQRDENGYQFNNIGFIDDVSIFADTPEGMQKLLNVVQEFTAWCGMQKNAKKTYLLIIDNDKKRREQEPAPLLTINGATLQAMNLDDACRYMTNTLHMRTCFTALSFPAATSFSRSCTNAVSSVEIPGAFNIA